MRILVTGASGFVGRALCAEGMARGMSIVGATRLICDLSKGVENVIVGYIDGSTDWREALAGCDAVIHLAARVHIMTDNSKNSIDEFRLINTVGTEHLARCAAAYGIKRLVYVSSIGVNGLFTSGEDRFSESDLPNPHNAYAVSKWEAEKALHEVGKSTGLEVVVVRPPLVYGANAPGNFAQLMRVVERGMPLPLASVHNRRDLIYVGNLVDALIVCATHPAAAGQTYLLSDGEPVSMPELLLRMAEIMGIPSRVFPFPQALLQLLGRLTGRSSQVGRLVGSLQVDSGKVRRELNWHPPYTLQQGLQAAADWYSKNLTK